MKRLLSLSLSLSLATAAAAANFLTPAALDLPALLPPPPAAGSPAARVELDQVLQLQTARTPEQAARCVQIESEDIWLFGSEVVGPWFTAANLPKTAAFFAQVREDFIAVNRAAKALHPRKRPPFSDERIKPCVEFADTGSYPSGHGIQSSMWAGLLAEISPTHARDFVLRAAVTRNFKAISGVHYPSDLAAGQAVGEALARELLKNPAVQKTIGELRAEIMAFSATQGQPAKRTSVDSHPSAKSTAFAHPAPPNLTAISGLNARWAEYGEYLGAVIEQVQNRWYEILRASKGPFAMGTIVTVTFKLDSKGGARITKVTDTGTGQAGISACRDAITHSQPYPKWPDPMRAALGKSQELTFSFYYQ